MELKLDIYENKKVSKTYTAETYDLMFGTIEDLLELIDIDNLTSDDEIELFKFVTKLVMGGLDIIKPIIKDVFDGLTDDELKRTKTTDVVNALINIVKFATAEIVKNVTEKN